MKIYLLLFRVSFDTEWIPVKAFVTRNKANQHAELITIIGQESKVVEIKLLGE